MTKPKPKTTSADTPPLSKRLYLFFARVFVFSFVLSAASCSLSSLHDGFFTLAAWLSVPVVAVCLVGAGITFILDLAIPSAPPKVDHTPASPAYQAQQARLARIRARLSADDRARLERDLTANAREVGADGELPSIDAILARYEEQL